MAINTSWDEPGNHLYETGVDRGMLYVYDKTAVNAADSSFHFGAGEAWSGLTGVTQSPEGAEANDFYADNGKYLSIRSAETFGATITAYQSPDGFDACDGTAEAISGFKLGQQGRKAFCFAYRSLIGNDTEGNDYDYKIHIVYNATAAPSERTYNSVNESPEPNELSWEIDTTAIDSKITEDGDGNPVTYKPVSHVELRKSELSATALTLIEEILYGKAAVAADAEHNIEAADAVPSRCPTPLEIFTIISENPKQAAG